MVAQIFERRPERFHRYAVGFAEGAVEQGATVKCHRHLQAGLYNFECRSDHLQRCRHPLHTWVREATGGDWHKFCKSGSDPIGM